jgi:AcrR family transcriptional regulator
MDQQRQDRRSRRTQQALMEALLALLNAKNYDEISINDIVECANVGHSTFYAHYQDKDDLLRNSFDRALEMLIQHLSFGEAGQDLKLDTTPLFLHAQGHYDLYRTLVWGSGFDVLTKDGHAALSAKFHGGFTRLLSGKPELPVPLDVLSYSLAGTLLILLKWGLDNKMPYPPEYMNGIFQQLVMPSIRNILSLAETKNK